MIKIGIVGCGLISTLKFIPYTKSLKNRVILAGICDLNEKILKQAADRFCIRDTYTKLEDMLESKHPDAIILCTPPKTHADLAIAAMERGAHVLVEKPMALTEEDCKKMNQTAVRYGKKLGVMHNQAFNPAFEKACRMVAEGKIGRFLGIRVFLMTSIHDMTEDKEHWAHKLPGGMVGETGPHAVYLSLGFLKKVRNIELQMKKHLPEYPWVIAEDIRFDLIADNGLSSIVLVYGSDQTTAELDIIGTRGLLKVDLQTRILVHHIRPHIHTRISSGAALKSVVSAVRQTVSSFIGNGIQYVFSKNLDGHFIGINRFLDYLEDKADFPASGEVGQEVERIMEMVVKRIEEIKR